MKKLISCEFNMDTGCVELRYADGGMIAIDCTAVERDVADDLYQRSEKHSSPAFASLVKLRQFFLFPRRISTNSAERKI